MANPRKFQLIYKDRRKSDGVDAEKLARVGRMDPKLLYPITHRTQSIAEDLAVIRSRDVLVRSRTQLINHVRGAVKSVGVRLSGCTRTTLPTRGLEQLPAELKPALKPVLETIRLVNDQIRELLAARAARMEKARHCRRRAKARGAPASPLEDRRGP